MGSYYFIMIIKLLFKLCEPILYNVDPNKCDYKNHYLKVFIYIVKKIKHMQTTKTFELKIWNIFNIESLQKCTY